MSPVFSPATRLKASVGLIAALCALAIPGVASAAAPGLASSSELTFPSDEAHVSGSRASFWVECSAAEVSSTCDGTLALTTNGKKHNLPFSVVAGTHQSLSVRLGPNSTAKRVVIVAKTAQADGGYVRSWGLLELR
ncbi:MAG TPA: hypothetical protein VN733_06950 [Solirubrobacterales bacterium]|nr:hypothetical protein [Solirubrobacterales bacterium]